VSAENYTIKGLAEIVQQVVPCEIELVEQQEDNRNYKVSSEKILWILKYQPKTSVLIGIEAMAGMIKKVGFREWEEDLYRNSSWEY